MKRHRDIDTITAEAAAEYGRIKEREFLFKAAKVRAMCESPIEEAFAVAALFWTVEHPSDDYLHICKGQPQWPIEFPFEGRFLFVQQAVGEYRADFLFADNRANKIVYVVVECDGHNFHERTKEQAARDKKRDRWMVGEDIRVLRFTGSEIWRAPFDCAQEAMSAVHTLAIPEEYL